MSSQIARKVVSFMQSGQVADPLDNNSPNKLLKTLSQREKEVLQLLANGMLYKEIACHLENSPETVRKHVYHVSEKLHVDNRVQAIHKLFKRRSILGNHYHTAVLLHDQLVFTFNRGCKIKSKLIIALSL
jgi:DNA-binding NarL/FixJ family response regulator